MEEEFKREVNEINRGDELRTTRAINQMREDVTAYLSANDQGDKVRALENTVTGLTEKCIQLQNALYELQNASHGFERLPEVGRIFNWLAGKALVSLDADAWLTIPGATLEAMRIPPTKGGLVWPVIVVVI